MTTKIGEAFVAEGSESIMKGKATLEGAMSVAGVAALANPASTIGNLRILSTADLSATNIKIGAAFDQANAAYNAANAASGGSANAAYDQANAAYAQANAAFTKANTANVTGQTAFTLATTANTNAATANVTGQTAISLAIVGNTYAQTAFSLANTANNNAANAAAAGSNTQIQFKGANGLLAASANLTFNVAVGRIEVIGIGELARLTTTGNVSNGGGTSMRFVDANGSAAFVGFTGTNDQFNVCNQRNGPIRFCTNDQDNMFLSNTGILSVVGAVMSNGGIRVSNTSPKIFLHDTDGASGGRVAEIRYNSNTFSFNLDDDSFGGLSTMMQFVRGTALGSIDNATFFQAQTFVPSANLVLGLSVSSNNMPLEVYRSTQNSVATFTGASTIPLTLGDVGNAPSNQLSCFIGPSRSALSSVNGDLVFIPRTSTQGRFLYYANTGSSTDQVAMLDNSGRLTLGDGSAAFPSHSFQSRPNTGMWWGSAGTLRFSVDGLETFRTQNGASVMQCGGTIGAGAAFNFLSIRDSVGERGWLGFGSGGSNNFSVVNATGNGIFQIIHLGSALYTISSGGTHQLAAGSNSSIRAVTIYSDFSSGLGPYVTWQNKSTAFGDIGEGKQMGSGFSANAFAMVARSGFELQFGAGGVTSPTLTISMNSGGVHNRININHASANNSNVAFAVANPGVAGLFYVLGDGQCLSGSGSVSLPGQGFYSDPDTGSYLIAGGNMGVAADGTLIAAFNKLNSTAGGTFVVGATSSVWSTGTKIEAFNQSDNWGINSIIAGNAASPYMAWNQLTSGDNPFMKFYTEASPALRGSIDYNRAGGVTRYNTTSDARLKKNIKDSLPAGSIIDAMKIRSFDWKDSDGHMDYWMVAQELHQVFPDAVKVGTGGEEIKPPDADRRGGDEIWAIDPSKLVPLLIKEIQDLRIRVKDLEINNTVH